MGWSVVQSVSVFVSVVRVEDVVDNSLSSGEHGVVVQATPFRLCGLTRHDPTGGLDGVG